MTEEPVYTFWIPNKKDSALHEKTQSCFSSRIAAKQNVGCCPVRLQTSPNRTLLISCAKWRCRDPVATHLLMLLRHSGVVKDMGQICVVVRAILAPMICYVKCYRIWTCILHVVHVSATDLICMTS